MVYIYTNRHTYTHKINKNNNVLSVPSEEKASSKKN